MDAVRELAERLKQAAHAVVLTGAGASTESGLPDFRSRDGLWRNVDPMKLASMTALRRNPVELFQFYRMRLSRLRDASPNPVHTGLAQLQQAGYVRTVITQNIDGLHQAAGATDVIEVHGSLRECVCLDCGRRFPSELIDVDVSSEEEVPRCPECDGLLKPGVVLFEEVLPMDAVDRAWTETQRADLFIVIGSSLEVGPVNQLPAMAVMGGADLAILNLEPTHLDGYARWVIRRRAGEAVSEIVRLLGL